MKKISLLALIMIMITSFFGYKGLTMNTHDTNKKTIIILLGPPGSGKGTQAEKLTKEFNLPHISTGDLFRENLKKGTALGSKVKSFMEAGRLVPDEIVIDMLMDRVSKDDCKHGYLLDGFPRSIPQAEALQKHIEKENVIVINLEVADDLVIKRIEGRLTCKQCGMIYNKYFTPSKHEHTCDKCEGELFQRSDDNKEVVMERLKVYHEQTAPLIDFYKKQNVLKSIDGHQDSKIVLNEIIDYIKSQINKS